jgi:hypothetical protein
VKASFIALALVLSPFAAGAQVIVNQAALDQLAGIPPAVITAPPEIRQPPHKIAYRPEIHKHVVAPPPATTLASSRIAAAPVAPKPAPPAAPVTPAPSHAQLAVAKPVLPKPVAPPPSAAVTFASGASDLPPGITAQLKPFCAKDEAGPITIDAYAAADPSDPSAAPRLSMARAFALRDALVACGVPSANIIPRADGTGKNPDIAQISTTP